MLSIVLVLLQLWNQPSIRMLGFGTEFIDCVPDPITDLFRNPAYLKEFGFGFDHAYSTPQIYSSTTNFSKPVETVEIIDAKSYVGSQERLMFMACWPRIGFGCKLRAFTLVNACDYSENWLYGQGGIFGALRLGEYFIIGGEYNYSWNDKPDERMVEILDSAYNWQTVPMYHGANSNEWGGGVILGDLKREPWQLAISYKRNFKTDTFFVDTWFHYVWPDGPSEWKENARDVYFNTRCKFDFTGFELLFLCDYYEETWIRCERFYNPEIDPVIRLEVTEPGISGIVHARADVMLVGAIILSHWDFNGQKTNGLILPFGVEKKFGNYLTCRFGNTFIYRRNYVYNGAEYDYHIKNELNFGMDFRPYEKLNLYLATRNPLEYSEWCFGLSLAL